MKKILCLLLPALLLFSCRIPLLELNYQELIDKHIEQINSDEGVKVSKTCPHLYMVKYPYCDFYKESDNIIDYGLQFDAKNCIEKPEQYQLLSIIELHDGEYCDSVMNVLLISFVYPIDIQKLRGKINQNFGETEKVAKLGHTERVDDLFSPAHNNKKDTIQIKGSALVYSGKYTNKDKTELHLTQRYIYRQEKLNKTNLELKTWGKVNLKLKIKTEGDDVLLCNNIVNFSHNRLAGNKAVVFDINETLGVDSIRFVEMYRPCSK
jgi:hypothetical protein